MTSSLFGYEASRFGWSILVVAYGLLSVFLGVKGLALHAALFGVSAVVTTLVGLAARATISFVTLDRDGITVQQGASMKQHPWSKVEAFSPSLVTSPPVYRFDFNDRTASVYCISGGFWVRIFGVKVGFDDFADYARKQLVIQRAREEYARQDLLKAQSESITPRA